MANVNVCILVGNVTRDLDLRRTPSGLAVVDIGLAVNRITGSGETKREETTFIDCVAWDKRAETMAKYLKKGSPVYIRGWLKLDRWDDASGEKRSKIRCVVEDFQFLAGKEDQGQHREVSGSSGGGEAAAMQNRFPDSQWIDPNETPF